MYRRPIFRDRAMGNHGMVLVCTYHISQEREFETMVFQKIGGVYSIDPDEINSLTTKKETDAIENHRQMLVKYRNYDF